MNSTKCLRIEQLSEDLRKNLRSMAAVHLMFTLTENEPAELLRAQMYALASVIKKVVILREEI